MSMGDNNKFLQIQKVRGLPHGNEDPEMYQLVRKVLKKPESKSPRKKLIKLFKKAIAGGCIALQKFGGSLHDLVEVAQNEIDQAEDPSNEEQTAGSEDVDEDDRPMRKRKRKRKKTMRRRAPKPSGDEDYSDAGSEMSDEDDRPVRKRKQRKKPRRRVKSSGTSGDEDSEAGSGMSDEDDGPVRKRSWRKRGKTLPGPRRIGKTKRNPAGASAKPKRKDPCESSSPVIPPSDDEEEPAELDGSGESESESVEKEPECFSLFL